MDEATGRPIFTRQSLSLRRQSTNLERPPSSYFTAPIPYSASEGSTPPPPYVSPQFEDEKSDDKRWIDLLERQNAELMEQITKLSTNTNIFPQKKGRPLSFHGSSPRPLEQQADVQSVISSNILIQDQLTTLREELVRTRRRCAELSEVEAHKKGLELRCIGLERVVEELMSALEFMKTHSKEENDRKTVQLVSEKSADEVKGLAIHIEDCKDENQILTFQQECVALVISARRRFIPYRLRAVVVFILARIRYHDYIDQLFATGIIVAGVMLWAAFMVVERVRGVLKFSFTTKSSARPTRRK